MNQKNNFEKDKKMDILHTSMMEFVLDYPPAENIQDAESFYTTEKMKTLFEEFTDQKVNLVEMRNLLEQNDYKHNTIEGNIHWMIKNK